MLDDVGHVLVARLDIRVAGVQVQIALRLVEGHGRQLARHGGGEEFVRDRAVARAAVAQVFGARSRAGRELLEVVQRLVVELEVRRVREAATAGGRGARGGGFLGLSAGSAPPPLRRAVSTSSGSVAIGTVFAPNGL